MLKQVRPSSRPEQLTDEAGNATSPRQTCLSAARSVHGPDGRKPAHDRRNLCGHPPPGAQARPVMARGAGLSYTGSFTVERPTVVVDMLRITDIEVNAEDRYATVGGGAVLGQCRRRAQALGMTATQINPISGAFATVGGWRFAGHSRRSRSNPWCRGGAGGRSVVQTGAPTHFHRYAGPDVTGLFLGDCGAFGIKTVASRAADCAGIAGNFRVFRVIMTRPTLESMVLAWASGW